MSLQVWFPFTKDLRNQGLDDVSITTTNASFIDTGKLGHCLKLGYTSDFNIPSMVNKKQISLAYWVKVNTATATDWLDVIRFYTSDGTSSGYNRQEFYTNCSSSGFFYDGGDSSGIGYGAIVVGEWYHFTTTVDYATGEIKTYRNGDLLNTKYNADVNAHITGSFRLGESGLDISMNDVRIYDHCLSPMEIKEISRGLVLHYLLNNNGLGQENLLLNTQVLTPTSSATNRNCCQRGSATRQLRVDGFYEAKCTANWQGLSTWANAQNLIVGQKYTYSFYFYTDGSSKYLSFYPMMYTSSWSRDTSSTLPISLDGGQYQNQNSRSFGSFSNTHPVRHYVTFEWNSTMASIINDGGFIELTIQVFGTFNTNEYSCIFAPKLEVGDVMTTWSPAPTDELSSQMGLNSNIEYDVSGFQNNGVRTGTFSWTSGTPKYEVSTEFSGTERIEANSLPSETQTLACWVNFSEVPSNNYNYTIPIFDKNSKLAIGVIANARLITYIGPAAGGAGTQIYTSFDTNKWYHIVVVKTGDNTRNVYINGELKPSGGGNWWGGDLDKLLIGCRHVSGGYSSSFKGQLCDVRAYATALSEEDVKSLYNFAKF